MLDQFDPKWISAVAAVLAIAGQAANAYLFQRLRADLLELEKRVLKQVAEEYLRKEMVFGPNVRSMLKDLRRQEP